MKSLEGYGEVMGWVEQKFCFGSNNVSCKELWCSSDMRALIYMSHPLEDLCI